MKFSCLVGLLCVSAALGAAIPDEDAKERDRRFLAALAPLVGWAKGAMASVGPDILSGMMGDIVNGTMEKLGDIDLDDIDELIDKLNQVSHDTSVLGRSIKVDVDGNTATATDRRTGLRWTVTADTPGNAIAQAVEELMVQLMKSGYISKHELHLPPTPWPVTQPPCGDMYGRSYCNRMKQYGYCDPGSIYGHFMKMNCQKTCYNCKSPGDK